MSRYDYIPVALRSEVGPTKAQWRDMVTALLVHDGVLKADLVTEQRIRAQGWLDEHGRINKRGLAVLLVMPELRRDRSSRFVPAYPRKPYEPPAPRA